MVILIAMLVGAIFGGLRAKKRKGKFADIALYAFVHALVFGLVTLFVLLILDRTVF